VLLRAKADGTQSYEPVARFDEVRRQFVSLPINLGVVSERVYLILFGTGIRHSSLLSAVSVKAGGVVLPVTYAGAQGNFAGLDQINAELPLTLTGMGEIDLVVTVGGQIANPVKINLGRNGGANLAAKSSTSQFAVVQPQFDKPLGQNTQLVLPPVTLNLRLSSIRR
jgi:hypothetical protein